jgi:hypothetical protein
LLADRRRQLAALTAGVTLAHLWLADAVLPPRLGEGAADTRPRRIEVAFVHELNQAAPLAAATVPPRPPPQAAPRVAAPAASAAQSAEPAPLPPVTASEPVEPPTPEPTPPLPDLPLAPPAVAVPAAQPVPMATAAAAAAASAPAVFEWPPSTRLTYRLTGNYRGPVEGQAQVEWLRSGRRYQVFMDVSIGPSFAPLMSRRVSSDGEITAEGLSPRRYDEVTKAVLRDARQLTIFLDADRVRLPNGREMPRPPGVQDSASQFVQLTWLFTTQPQWLETGRAIELPLALPRQVEPWTYDVLGPETLATPAGAVQTVHIKPRREPRPGGDLTAEFWVAPSLQYLPVRILIRQDAETFIDLSIDRLPEQAERERDRVREQQR